MDLGPALPVLPQDHVGDILHDSHDSMQINPLASDNGSLVDIDLGNVFPFLAFFGMAGVLIFLLNHFYRGKSKHRRKKPRIRRFVNYGVKTPGV